MVKVLTKKDKVEIRRTEIHKNGLEANKMLKKGVLKAYTAEELIRKLTALEKK